MYTLWCAVHFLVGLGSEGIPQLQKASGKHRVSTRISRARVICPRASFVPENLWEEIPRARHLVNDARICGTNFWRDMTRASKFSKLPDFQNFARFSKFCPIFKFLPNVSVSVSPNGVSPNGVSPNGGGPSCCCLVVF